MTDGELLENLVSLYNAGVRTRDFAGLLAMLSDDAILDFEGVPGRGAFTGKPQIAQHFHDDPPDDRIRVKRWKHSGAGIIAEFRWLDIPEGGGCLYIEPRGERVARVTLIFGGPRRTF